MINKNDSNVVFVESIESDPKRTESEISNLSFKRWHKRMQIEHELLEREGKASPFKLWKWCHKSFLPCRWFDSIDYNKKISKCCLTFKTFKNIGTIILIALFSYIFMYSILKKEVVPGGSVFFLFFLFVTAYLVGYIATLLGLPGMIGHLVTGITFGNVPHHWLPERDDEFIQSSAKIAEKVLLVLSLIRSGLLLDLSRMKNRLRFIVLVATFPFLFEFLIVWLASHFLLSLEWDWSALQGSTISIVSLATVTSIMEKNKKLGYGEDKHLSTVLIAAAVINVLLGLIMYFICLTYIIQALYSDNKHAVYWRVLLSILKQSLIGMAVGFVAGLLVSFFPDKRNPEAAGLRILVIGIGSFGITSFLSVMDMNVAGAIACLLLCFICTNMWEELGWHQDSNPVLYFYTMAYYTAQPLVISLLGYTMNLKESSGKDIGLSVAVFLIGIAGRESMCILVLKEKSYPTTLKEKIFICIAWLSKGTFQALLAFSIFPLIEKKKDLGPPVSVILTNNSNCIKRTTVLAILFITPLVCYGLTLLTPKLLTKNEEFSLEETPKPDFAQSRKARLSISRYQDTTLPSRKMSNKYTSDLNIHQKLPKSEPETSRSESEKTPKRTGKDYTKLSKPYQNQDEED